MPRFAKGNFGLVRRNPDHYRIGQELGEVYNILGSTRLRANLLQPAKEAYLKSRALLERLQKLSPGDENGTDRLTDAYSGLGECEARLGQLKEALATHQMAVLRREESARRHPHSASHQRNLMLTLSHVGDVQGNPGLPNLGDMAGARATFHRLVEIARRLHVEDPADQRAKSDYGIAMVRSANAMEERSRERIEILDKSIRLLGETTKANPANRADRAELVRALFLLGISRNAAGDSAAALRAYRDGMRLNAPLLAKDTGRSAMDSILLTAYAGEIHASRSERAESAALVSSVLELAAADGPYGKGRPPAVQVAITARANAHIGMIYHTLGQKADARRHLIISRDAYGELEKKGALTGAQRKSLGQVQRLLEETPR
ncbi:MAG: hypothetical protein FJW38_24495 [Acidobacteria bacterium]|nr:hypothetical protein [Acidobacteriota bacterium]